MKNYLSLFLIPFLLILGCASSETQQGNKDVEFPVKLFVNNGNGRNFNPAHIKVTFYGNRGRDKIYHNVVVDEEFTENGGHNWKSFNLSLKEGHYTVFVECTNDSSKMTVSFEIDKPLWMLLEFVDNNHFSLNICESRFVFD
jgi:hypothetical protein